MTQAQGPLDPPPDPLANPGHPTTGPVGLGQDPLVRDDPMLTAEKSCRDLSPGLDLCY